MLLLMYFFKNYVMINLTSLRLSNFIEDKKLAFLF